MTPSGAEADESRSAFDRRLGELRPKLHRYCARMTGSVIDGEDVVQEALMKAIKALPKAGRVANLDGWLFRIAHNAALDFLRRRRRYEAIHSNEEAEMTAALINPVSDRQAAAASLRTLMRLPVTQRSCVILMDVLGHSLDEISQVTETSIPAVKAALNRGRRGLREIANEPEDLSVPALAEPERLLLAKYVDNFNARDFDAVRDMLADEVRLELVNKTRMNGKREVGRYFHNYSDVDDWHFVPGLVDGRPALLVRDPRDPSAAPSYFVLLQWVGDKFTNIRDFRHARYAIEGAEVVIAG
ncbi:MULTISPECIES: sigma-70 family RNA polymerase sigma factor [unclassified Rhizobium]|uniref:sigma-70 family RNA polymerase sigma factor n=1 Tax=unclassified Rhizobium TaxID=2613769 RepID=UPI000EAAAC29|nr:MULTISPECIES: sigma-70 family RNA polymerase sigma factor [unclassified Rhizobium]AYG64935.1 sigma-70 family RNA polymerase sigma factor [Rhizobium sp. CCGE531]AYG71420.1 sigma-70 family RNA polymerase sigma factor [Rhizobium sp. CCGE532]